MRITRVDSGAAGLEIFATFGELEEARRRKHERRREAFVLRVQILLNLPDRHFVHTKPNPLIFIRFLVVF